MKASFYQSITVPLFVTVNFKHHIHPDIQVAAMPKLPCHDPSTTYGNALTNVVVTGLDLTGHFF